MIIGAGLGYHDVVIDISASISAMTDLSRVEARVMAPDEGIVSHDASLPTVAAGSTSSPHIFVDTVTTAACNDEDHTFLKFRHEFAQHGDHRIALTYWNSNGEYTTAPSAVVVQCGDGLFGDCQ
jgi:hypothetical protein